MNIQGSNINVAALSGVKSLADLKRLDIFSHLDKEMADKANNELWTAIKPAEVMKPTAVDKSFE